VLEVFDYATSSALRSYVSFGLIVWIFMGEVVADRRGLTYSSDVA
jgi:hypothetical protein